MYCRVSLIYLGPLENYMSKMSAIRKFILRYKLLNYNWGLQHYHVLNIVLLCMFN